MPMEKVTKKQAITKPEFHRRLRKWFASTSEQQIAPGDSQHVVIKDGTDYFRFDADTSREAVSDYLELLDRFGDSILWTAVPSRKGPKTKIAVGPAKVVMAPLYLYLLIKRGAAKDRIARLSPHEADRSESPVETEADARERLCQQIRVRRGQQKFRDALLKRYEDTCLVTGCRIVDLLEAAHIRILPGQDDNRVENGLLLRADIHTLFDLGLLVIDPQTLTVRLDPSISDSEYARFEGQPLRDRKGKPLSECRFKPSAEALQTRVESVRK